MNNPEYDGGMDLNRDVSRGQHRNEFADRITKKIHNKLKTVFDGKSISEDVTIDGRQYNIVSVPINADHTDAELILVVMQNISLRKKLENQLKRKLELEGSCDSAKSQFVMMASHELKTPLATILSSTFLLENYTRALHEPEIKKHLERIKGSVQNLTEFLNDVLSLGRLQEGKVAPHIRRIDIARLVNEILLELSVSKKEDQEIKVEYSGKTTTAATDKQLLRTILSNLLSNAIKYSPPGTEISLNISIGQMLNISITDHGIGIPDRDRNRIFQRFFRANNTDEIQGTGLGLYIVKKYVRILKGTITFTSEAEQGTTFIVNIPAEQKI